MSVTMSTIPASEIVQVVPSVLSGGGAALDLIELMLTTNPRVPIGSVIALPESSVAGYFGATSNEATEADVYYSGFTGATVLPGSLLFVQYPIANVGAYLRGGSIANLTLTQLQALTGLLTITIDGTAHTSSSINLSSATSFTNAAQMVTQALGLTGPTQASVTASIGATFTGTASGANLTASSVVGLISKGDTIVGTGISGTVTIVSQTSGTTGGAGVYVTSATTTASAAAITATSSVVDVTIVASGTLAVGQQITGTNVTADTFIVGLGTGTGGAGTYNISVAQQVASEAMTTDTPTVTYDSLSGAMVVISGTTGATSTISYGSGTISSGLALTQATGAILSQGAVAGVPATFMNAVIAQTTNWATFQTLFDPDAGSGNTQKQLFAAWANAQNNRYAYLAWDTDITPTESTAATSSLGYILKQSDSSGTFPIYQAAGTNLHLAAFVGGYAASIDWDATNGRANAAFRSQAGLSPSVTTALASTNLKANGYNYYGSFSTANQSFDFLYPGQISGPFAWLDSFLGQIWLNNQIQLALMTMLTQFRTIPYTPAGNTIVRQTVTGGAGVGPITLPPASPVAAALNNGVIVPGVALSAEQAQFVNTSCGFAVDSIITKQGFYLLIQPATSQVRAARSSPPITLFYTDGGSLQQITLGSVEIQ